VGPEGDNPYVLRLNTALRRLDLTIEPASFKRLASGKYDIWHLHWPERAVAHPSFARAVARSIRLLALLLLARARKVRIVWTVHNLRSHERPHALLEKAYSTLFPRLVDGFLCLSESSRAEVLHQVPALRHKPGFVTRHGHFRDDYPVAEDPAKTRALLGISSDQRIILYVGTIRGYKNVPHLIETFRSAPLARAKLVVAGKPFEDGIGRAVRLAAEGDGNVQLLLKRLAPQEIANYLAAADLAVLPFDEILNSGSAILCLSFNLPVLVPRKGSMAELQSMFGDSWVRTYEGNLTPSELGEALTWASQARPERVPLEELNWDTIARKTKEAFAAICASRSARR
jgi:glycosyltransferase involved in cell wall biosynthesis